MQRSVLCRSRRELSNEYLVAKIGFDTAEKEPSKVCPLSVYRSPRFIFDVIIVAIMNVELLLFPYLVESDSIDPQAIADPTVLRTLRLLRLLRAGPFDR